LLNVCHITIYRDTKILPLIDIADLYETKVVWVCTPFNNSWITYKYRMATTGIKVDVKPALDYLQSLPEQLHKKVILQSLTDLTRKSTTQIKDVLYKQYNIKKSDLGISYRVTGTQAFITASSRSRNIAAFKSRQTTTGITAEVTRGSKESIAHAFFATMKNGKTLGFIRHGKALVSIYKLSIGLLLRSEWVTKVLQQTVSDNADTIIHNKIKSYLKRS